LFLNILFYIFCCTYRLGFGGIPVVPSTQPIPPTTAPTTTPTATTPSSNAPQPNRNPLGSAQSANYFSQMLNMMANNSIVNIFTFIELK
jgi:hypothetical protein